MYQCITGSTAIDQLPYVKWLNAWQVSSHRPDAMIQNPILELILQYNILCYPWSQHVSARTYVNKVKVVRSKTCRIVKIERLFVVTSLFVTILRSVNINGKQNKKTCTI